MKKRIKSKASKKIKVKVVKTSIPKVKAKAKVSSKNKDSLLARIKVIGIGGAGSNAITRMSRDYPRGVELVAMNTDIQDLQHAVARKKIQIGKNITKGLGTGMNPDLGRQAAEESRAEIANVLTGADMIFLTVGMGGGTGSGVSPVVAEMAKEMGILSVAIVTKPFGFEGAKRGQIAEESISKLKDHVDMIITIPNDRIFSLISKETSLVKAFEEIDEVLKNSVFGITELINTPGLINIDFADVKTIIQDGGAAIIGIGIASGAERATAAANAAINSPLLELSIDGAKGVLFSISGQRDLKMTEINDIAQLISENVDPSARIIFGTYHDRKLNKGQLKVTLIATGFNGHMARNNILFPNLFATAVKKEEIKSGIGSNENSENPNQGVLKNETLILEKKEEVKNLKEIPLFEKKTDFFSKQSKEEKDEVWDIPAFLRKKKKKNNR